MKDWNYSGDPSKTSRDAVRFKIGDTIEKDPLLTDSEIAAMITEHTSVLAASVHCVLAILAKFSRLVSETAEDVSVSLSDRVKHYQELLKVLDEQAGGILTSAVVPVNVYAGGISRDDKQIREEDTDRDRPFFRRDSFNTIDNPDLDDFDPDDSRRF